MKRINDFINNNLLGLMASLLIISVMFLALVFIISDKYDDDLYKLTNENNELKNKIKEQEKQLTEQINSIDYLLEHGNECNCGWYEDFYYDNSAECGAYE